MDTMKQALTKKMNELSQNDKVRFIGYNTAKGHQMYGTLALPCPLSRSIEAPVAENLMMGLGMGMALKGFIPIVSFERMDFILPAMDALVNHMDKLPFISGNQFQFKMIVRIIVGTDKPINPGCQHTGSYIEALDMMLKNTPILPIMEKQDIKGAYNLDTLTRARVVVEYKLLYT